MGGIPPNPPKAKALMSNAPFTLSRSCGELTHNHAPCCSLVGSRGIWGSPPPTRHRGQLVDNRTPERGRERLANIHPRA